MSAKDRITLSKSAVEAARPCDRAIALSLRLGLRRLQYVDHMLVGAGVHAGLAAYYSGKDEAEVLEASRLAIAQGLSQLPVNEPDAEPRIIQEAERLLSWYIRNAEDEPWVILATETAFNVQVGPANLVGVLDLVAQTPDGLIIVDHKTTRSVGSNYFLNADRDAQVFAYFYAAAKLGIEVQGFLFNVITRTKEPQLHRFLVRHDPHLLAVLESRLVQFAEKVASLPNSLEGILALPGNGLVCRGCPFWELCLDPAAAQTTLELLIASGELYIADHSRFYKEG